MPVSATNLDNCEYIEKRSTPALEKVDQWRNCEPVPYVGPGGEFEIRFVDLRKTTKGEFKEQLDGLTPVHFSNGTISIARWAASVGYVLYEDLCKGKAESLIDGELVPVERHDGAWRAWKNYVGLMRKGVQLPSSKPAPSADGSPVVDNITAQMYHPEVIRRREQAKRGGQSTLSEERALAMILATSDEDMLRAQAGAESIRQQSEDIATQLSASAQTTSPGRKK